MFVKDFLHLLKNPINLSGTCTASFSRFYLLTLFVDYIAKVNNFDPVWIGQQKLRMRNGNGLLFVCPRWRN